MEDEERPPEYDVPRGEKRVPIRIPLLYRSGEAEEQVTGALNLSATGMQFKGAEPLAPGASIEVTMVLPGQSEPLCMSGEVRWCAEDSHGLFNVGVEFGDATEEERRMLKRAVNDTAS